MDSSCREVHRQDCFMQDYEAVNALQETSFFFLFFFSTHDLTVVNLFFKTYVTVLLFRKIALSNIV